MIGSSSAVVWYMIVLVIPGLNSLLDNNNFQSNQGFSTIEECISAIPEGKISFRMYLADHGFVLDDEQFEGLILGCNGVEK